MALLPLFPSALVVVASGPAVCLSSLSLPALSGIYLAVQLNLAIKSSSRSAHHINKPLPIFSLLLDTPILNLTIGSSLDPSNIREGDDVYFECHVAARPAVQAVQWTLNVSTLGTASTLLSRRS